MSTEGLPTTFDPSEPLTIILDERYERLAQLGAMGFPKQLAAWEAGFRAKGNEPVRPGNVARYFRDPRVRARMAFLASDEVEVVAATRRFVHERLMTWSSLDLVGQFAIVGEVEVGGKKVPRILGFDLPKIIASGQSSAITKFKFDRETGVLTEFDGINPADAISQLRDMYGLRAPRKLAAVIKDMGEIDLSQYTDDELVQLENLLAMGEARAVNRRSAGGETKARD